MQILLVEDNNALANLLRAQLRRMGDYSVSLTSTKSEALQAFAEESFDLIMIDMGLEGIPNRGLEILQAMKSINPDQRIGVLSSNDLKDVVAACETGGAEFYMIKPFTYDGLKIILEGEKVDIENYQPRLGEGRIITF